MIKVSILDQSYHVRDKWEDNTIKQMSKAQDYISSMPIWLSEYIYGTDEEKKPISEPKFLDFMVDWIEIFSNIPREYLESEIKVEDPEDVSIKFLFDCVAKFLGEPTEEEIGKSETIVLGKQEYKLIESVKTAGGIEKLLSRATYKHFAEAQALSKLFMDKKYRKWEYLSQITALLFREHPNEQYNEEVIDMRTKAFNNLKVSEAYRGYFFLSSSLTDLQESMLTSLTVKKESQSTLFQKLSCRISTGIKKLMRSLKRVFSTKKD